MNISEEKKEAYMQAFREFLQTGAYVSIFHTNKCKNFMTEKLNSECTTEEVIWCIRKNEEDNRKERRT